MPLRPLEGSTPARTGLTPDLLHDLGCSLILDGEAVYRIDVDQSGTVTLRRASDWDISGGPDEGTWRYRLTLAGPSRNAQVNLPAVAVFHPRINAAPAEPHKGRSPIGIAAQSARLAAGLERQLGNEATQPSGQLLPHPEGVGEGRVEENSGRPQKNGGPLNALCLQWPQDGARDARERRQTGSPAAWASIPLRPL